MAHDDVLISRYEPATEPSGEWAGDNRVKACLALQHPGSVFVSVCGPSWDHDRPSMVDPCPIGDSSAGDRVVQPQRRELATREDSMLATGEVDHVLGER